MKNFFLKILQGYEFNSTVEWLLSLFPSFKYNFTLQVASVSLISSGIQAYFGLDGMALIGLILTMLVELVSGITASTLRKEAFSSSKFSRFLFKVFYYMVLIAAPFLIGSYYRSIGKFKTASIYDWLNTLIIMVIVFEHFISILENISVIEGKDKTHFIQKLKKKFDSLL